MFVLGVQDQHVYLKNRINILEERRGTGRGTGRRRSKKKERKIKKVEKEYEGKEDEDEDDKVQARIGRPEDNGRGIVPFVTCGTTRDK